MRYFKAWPAIAVSVVVVLAAPAWGHVQTRLDPDDTSGPLDLVAVRHSHGTTDSGKVVLRFRVVTYETWDDSTINASGSSSDSNIGDQFISIELDLDGDGGVDRCVVVTRAEVKSGDFRLEGNVFKDCKYFNDQKLGRTLAVSRPDKHSLRLAVRTRLLAMKTTTYRWRVVTAFEREGSAECSPSDPHGDGGYAACTDFSRWARHSFEVDD